MMGLSYDAHAVVLDTSGQKWTHPACFVSNVANQMRSLRRNWKQKSRGTGLYEISF